MEQAWFPMFPKDTSFEEQFTFSAVPHLRLEGFFWKITVEYFERNITNG
jgi:hypothetical protein